MPFFASDYASTNSEASESYYEYVGKLQKAKHFLIEDLIERVNGGPFDRFADGKVSVMRFAKVAKEIDLYDGSELRKRALSLMSLRESYRKQEKDEKVKIRLDEKKRALEGDDSFFMKSGELEESIESN